MTIHAKNFKPGCISYFFTRFSSESCCVPPPRDAPGALSYIWTMGSDIAKMKEGDLRNPKMQKKLLQLI